MDERIWHRHYDDGVPRSMAFEDLPLPGFLERAADRHPEGTAVLFGNGRLTYRRLKEDVDRLATALTAMEVARDSRVAIHLPNVPQAVIATLATLSLGAQAVMTNPLYVPREIEHQWNDAECSVAVTADYLYRRVLEPVRRRLPVRHYVVASIAEYLRFPVRQLAPWKLRRARPPLTAAIPNDPTIHPFRRLLRVTPPRPPRPVLEMEDIACLQYTGGTTGLSKGAVLTHGNLSRNVQQLAAWLSHLQFGREVFLAALPYFHIFGLTVCMLLPVYVASAMVLMPNPRDVSALVKGISKRRVTILPAVPAMFRAINEHPGIQSIDIRSVKSCFSGSAPLPADVLERFEELTGSRIMEGFGLTETSPVTHVNPVSGLRKIGSVGIPVPETDARIVHADDPALPRGPGQEGELLIRGPQVMREYWGRPEETAGVLREGWLHTGDLAVMDEDGYFTIVGRKKDMILASGYNVYPDEIDGVLMSHPGVFEACTIGLPDAKRGETVKSFIVKKPGHDPSAQEILAFCREHLAAYKVPGRVEFRDELPKSSMLKILRRILRDEEAARGPGGSSPDRDGGG